MCSEEEEEQQGNGVEVPSSEEESEPEDAPLDAEDEEEVRIVFPVLLGASYEAGYWQQQGVACWRSGVSCRAEVALMRAPPCLASARSRRILLSLPHGLHILLISCRALA